MRIKSILMGIFLLVLISCSGSKDDGGTEAKSTDWVQDAYLKASNSEGGDRFGSSVFIRGDYIGIAAPLEGSSQTTITNDDGVASSDNSASSSGAVYVFRKDTSGNWIQDAYLKASNCWSGDIFGSSVSISGDYIVVGAQCESSNQTTVTNDDGSASSDRFASNSGAAYVFKKDTSGIWIQDAYLKASNCESDDFFGSSVSISGDYIVVGAYCEYSNQTIITNYDGVASSDNSASASGAAYVFKKDTSGNWIQDAYLKASNCGSGDLFGYSVFISENNIIVGAVSESSNQTAITNDDGVANSDNSASSSGAAYVFRKDTSGNWIQDAYLKASNCEAGDYFGYSVSLSGDYIVVGANQESSNQMMVTNDDGVASSNNWAPGSGAAYVFKRDTSGNWIQDAYLKASNCWSGDNFGYSVAISGDYIVVGAYGESSSQTTATNDDGIASGDDSAGASGAAYVFKKDTSGNWVQDAYLKPSNCGAGYFFGNSLSISGDYIVVGAIGESSSQATVTNDDGMASSDNSASNSGAAYVFTLK